MTYTIPGFISLLGRMSAGLAGAQHHALEQAARIVETEAKRVIGTYDYGWPQLAASTLAKKSANTPLLETGDMRDSIEHMVIGDTAHVGTDDEKAVYQELGTATIPPRSFLAQAAIHKEKDVVAKLGGEMHSYLITR